MNYAEKLKDPRWIELAKEIRARDEFKCKNCGEKDEELHVHHIKYYPNMEPWEYPKEDLITYCESCHRLLEGKYNDTLTCMLNIFPYKYELIKYFSAEDLEIIEVIVDIANAFQTAIFHEARIKLFYQGYSYLINSLKSNNETKKELEKELEILNPTVTEEDENNAE